MIKKLFTIILIYFLTTKVVFAISPIEFSEISFKDTKGDWIELKINSEINGFLQIKNKKDLYTIDKEALLNKKFILIRLKATTNKDISTTETLEKHIKKGTLNNTEGKICSYIDEVEIECICWGKISQCIQSKPVKRNQSVIRENNWKPIQNPTPGLPNGQKSYSIKLSEVFPNPKGVDSKKEWVEIVNTGNTNVDLTNWKINNTTINKIIQPHSLITTNTKLQNKKNTIILYDFTNEKMDEITYPKAPENLSYSKTNNQWLWMEPSKGKENPKTKSSIGYITSTSPLTINFKSTKTSIQKELIKIFKDGDQVKYLSDDHQVYEIRPLNKTFFLHHVIHYLNKLTSSNFMIWIK